jgi:hypothetical protein
VIRVIPILRGKVYGEADVIRTGGAKVPVTLIGALARPIAGIKAQRPLKGPESHRVSAPGIRKLAGKADVLEGIRAFQVQGGIKVFYPYFSPAGQKFLLGLSFLNSAVDPKLGLTLPTGG